MKPDFDDSTISRLTERTEYESWLLEAIYYIAEENLFPVFSSDVIYPIDRSKPKFFANARVGMRLRDWRPGFLNAGAPLVFVSIFKLLDMLIEWVLEENGYSSNLKFFEKLEKLKESPIFPDTIEARCWLKERIIGLYETLTQYRNTIVHNRYFSVTDGTIRVSSSKKGDGVFTTLEISAPQLKTLACAIISVLRYVDGTWQINQFREKSLRRHLDELQTLHGRPLLNQIRPFHARVRVFLRGDEPLCIDPSAIRRDLTSIYLDADCSFDLHILLVLHNQVTGAYLFPWSLLEDADESWGEGLDLQMYRTELPDDISPEHFVSKGP